MTKDELKSLDCLKESQVFYLSTVKDGNPSVRPFGAINVYEDKLYICTNKNKEVYHQLLQNNNICIAGLVQGKCWYRITAKFNIDDSIQAKKSFLDNKESLRDLYTETDSSFCVGYLTDLSITIN
jgi:uncharacterized pyridoxamine 5'-phosphate oxidase family protein